MHTGGKSRGSGVQAGSTSHGFHIYAGSTSHAYSMQEGSTDHGVNILHTAEALDLKFEQAVQAIGLCKNAVQTLDLKCHVAGCYS